MSRKYYIYSRRLPGPLVVEATSTYVEEGDLVLSCRGDVVARVPRGALVLDEGAHGHLTDDQRAILNVDPGPPPPPSMAREVRIAGGGFPLLAWHHLAVAAVAFCIGWASALGQVGVW